MNFISKQYFLLKQQSLQGYEYLPQNADFMLPSDNYVYIFFTIFKMFIFENKVKRVWLIIEVGQC